MFPYSFRSGVFEKDFVIFKLDLLTMKIGAIKHAVKRKPYRGTSDANIRLNIWVSGNRKIPLKLSKDLTELRKTAIFNSVSS